MSMPTVRGPWTGPSREDEMLADRLPPFNLRAEMGVLGSILVDNSVMAAVSECLCTADFYRARHQVIYRAVLALYTSGRSIDAITVCEELNRHNEYVDAGGDEYLADIVNSVPHALDAKYYAEIVREKAIARELIDFTNELLSESYSNAFTAEEMVQRFQRRAAAFDARVGNHDQVEVDGRIAPPPFPLDVLPFGMTQFVKLHSRALPCAPDFIAVPGLSVAAAAMGRSVTLKLKRTWYEEANLWTVIAGTPGSTKSPALKAVTAPLKRMMRELRKQHELDVMVWKEAKRAEEKEWRKTGGKGASPIDPDDRPIPERRIMVMNTTTEALTPILAENPRGILMVCDELSGWLNSMNQYRGGGADKEFFLMLWNRASLVNDRKGTDMRKSIFIPDPFFAISGAITIDLLKQIPASIDGKRQDDGFFERPLYAIPDNVVPYWTEDIDPDEVDAEWQAALKRLYDREMRHDEEFGLRPNVICLSPDAHDEFTTWYDAHVAETQGEDFPKELKGAWSKFRSHFARLLLALDQLHWAYDPTAPFDVFPDITASRVRDAIRLIDYFKTHFRIVLSHVQGAIAENDDARAILRWASSRPEPRFTEREAKHNFRGRFREHPENLGIALEWLVERSLVRKIVPPPRGDGGRPKLPVYEIYPSALTPS